VSGVHENIELSIECCTSELIPWSGTRILFQCCIHKYYYSTIIMVKRPSVLGLHAIAAILLLAFTSQHVFAQNAQTYHANSILLDGGSGNSIFFPAPVSGGAQTFNWPTGGGTVATQGYVTTLLGNYLPLAGGTMSGNILLATHNVSGAGTVSANTFTAGAATTSGVLNLFVYPAAVTGSLNNANASTQTNSLPTTGGTLAVATNVAGTNVATATTATNLAMPFSSSGSTGVGLPVFGITQSGGGIGIQGNAGTGGGYGVIGRTGSGGIGVDGIGTGTGVGVYATSQGSGFPLVIQSGTNVVDVLSSNWQITSAGVFNGNAVGLVLPYTPTTLTTGGDLISINQSGAGTAIHGISQTAAGAGVMGSESGSGGYGLYGAASGVGGYALYLSVGGSSTPITIQSSSTATNDVTSTNWSITHAGAPTFAADASVNGVIVGTQGGSQSTKVGNGAVTNFNNSTSIGFFASNGSSGADNTAVGTNALRNAGSPTHTTAIGEGAGGNSAFTGGDGNTFLGNASGNGASGILNATAIGYRANVTTSNSLVLGSIVGVNGAVSSTNVGIGTTAPVAMLSVGTSSALQVDASGNLSTTGTLAIGSGTPIKRVLSAGVDISGVTISGGTTTSGTISGGGFGALNNSDAVIVEFTNTGILTTGTIMWSAGVSNAPGDAITITFYNAGATYVVPAGTVAIATIIHE
jgi:hypothetical protein